MTCQCGTKFKAVRHNRKKCDDCQDFTKRLNSKITGQHHLSVNKEEKISRKGLYNLYLEHKDDIIRQYHIWDRLDWRLKESDVVKLINWCHMFLININYDQKYTEYEDVLIKIIKELKTLIGF